MIIFSTVLILSSYCMANSDVMPEDSLSDSKIVLVPINKAVISSLVDTSVLKYNFKEGEVFNKGDVIVVLDDNLYRNAYDAAKAGYEQALASYKYTENTFEQNKNLFSKGGLSVQEFEKVKLDMASTISQLKEAKANMNNVEIKLQACEIKAPYSGRLTEKIVAENEFVRAGQPIMEIINDSKLLAVMYLPSNEIKNYKENDSMLFFIDETATKQEGKVYEVSGYVYSGSRSFEVKAIIDNQKRDLFSGMSGSLLKETGGSFGNQ